MTLKRARPWLAGVALALSGVASAAQLVILYANIEIPLETTTPLSSKTSVKGDLVALRTTNDVLIDGRIIVPKGTPATGQVSDARAKGALGMSGKLLVQPLYLTIGNTIVRLEGRTANKGTVSAGAVIGMAVLTPGFTGRSATIPAGARLAAFVARNTVVTIP